MSFSPDWLWFAVGFGAFPVVAILAVVALLLVERMGPKIARGLRVMWKAQVGVLVQCEVCAGLSFVWRIRALSNAWANRMPPYHPVRVQSVVLVCRECLPHVSEDFHRSVSP